MCIRDSCNAPQRRSLIHSQNVNSITRPATCTLNSCRYRTCTTNTQALNSKTQVCAPPSATNAPKTITGQCKTIPACSHGFWKKTHDEDGSLRQSLHYVFKKKMLCGLLSHIKYPHASLSYEWRETGSSSAPDNISHPRYIIPTTVPHHGEVMTGGT